MRCILHQMKHQRITTINCYEHMRKQVYTVEIQKAIGWQIGLTFFSADESKSTMFYHFNCIMIRLSSKVSSIS